MADTEPGLFETWRRTRRERKAREAMATEMPPDIAAEITADAAGLNDPQPVRGRSESLREFLQRTPHRFEPDPGEPMIGCVCRLGSLDDIHYGGGLLDTSAYVAARLEEIRTGWPVPVPEAAAEGAPQETTVAESAPPPDAASVYLVARAEGGVILDTTHTTAMDLETARREAKMHGVSSVREWFPVELRRVSGG